MSTNVGAVDFELLLNSNKFNQGIKTAGSTIQKSGIETSLKNIGKAAIAAFSVKAVVDFGKTCVNAATETSNAWIGLNSILTGQNKSFQQAQNFINEYISDGLVPLNNAVAAYKNLALRGYSSDQIQKTMNALKNSATFARQSTYTLGEAVQTATEGLKNENSVVVDNAGVTKNVAKMWEDYAASIGKTTNNLTQQEKIQAEVNGILEETKFQSNDASIYANTFSGKLAQLNTAFTNMKVAVGNVIQPIAKIFIPIITSAVNAVTNLFSSFSNLLSLFGLQADSVSTLSNGLESVSNNATNASDAVSAIGESAKKSAKNLKSLASFDTAQVLKSDNDSSSSGGSGASGSINTSGLNLTENIKQQVTDMENILNEVNFEPLKQSFNNLKEAISYFGQGCGKILDGFYNNYLKPLGNYVISDALPHFLNSTAEAIKGIDFDKLKGSFDELWKSLEPFTENIGNGLLWFYDNVLLPIGSWTINDVLPAFLNILTGALDILNQAIEDIQPIWQWFWDNVLSPIVTWTGGVIVDVLNGIGDALKWISDNELAMSIIEGVAIAIGLVTGALALYNIAMGVCNAVTGVFAGVMSLLTSPITIVIAILGALIAVIILCVKHWDEIKEAASKCWEAIKTAWNNAGQWFNEKIVTPIKDFFKNLWDNIKNTASNAWNGIKNIFSGVGNWFTNIFQQAYNGIRKVFSNIGSFFSNIWNSIKNTFSNLGTSIGNAISGAVKSGINGVISLIERTINSAINLINGGISLINLIPGVNIGKIKTLSLPRLAEGGYVKANTPQLAMIGDNRHQGEIVAPEDKILDLYKQANKEIGTGDTAKIIELLNKIIQLLDYISNQDIRLFIDGYELLKRLEKVYKKKNFAKNGG